MQWFAVYTGAVASRLHPSLNEELASGLSRVRRRIFADAERRLAERGESMLQWQVLSLLQRSGPLSQAELAAGTGQHPTGMSRLLEELEQAGLVRRHRDAKDRRRVQVGATARGIARVAQGRPLVDAAIEQVLAPLGIGERRTLRTLLLRMLQA